MQSRPSWVHAAAAVAALMGVAMLIVAFLVGDASMQHLM